MSDISINQSMAAMRLMAAQAKSPMEVNSVNPVNQHADFGGILKSALDTVNTTGKAAGKLALDFETGENNVSLAEVMIAKQKAGLSFQAMLQVRNKLVTAYKDVMTMPI